MNKRMKSIFIFLMAMVAWPCLGLAGTESSGGGGAFVCRDTKGEILNSELLDLLSVPVSGAATQCHQGLE